MTTTVVPENDLAFPWDHFLKKADPSETQVRMVNGFRQSEWPAIVRYLLEDYRWKIPDGLEPHWVTSGKAVYWQEQTRRVRKQNDDGEWEAVWETVGWEPTAPLPANNAGQVAHYLNKGFRLRPPEAGVADAYKREFAGLPEVTDQTDDRPTYTCDRHGAESIRVFRTWDAYIAHCVHFKEVPNETPPADVLAQMAEYAYYCPLHNVGFKNYRSAWRHHKMEIRKPGRAAHPTAPEMRVKKEEANA